MAKIFNNKYFLYLMVFLAITNVIGYLVLRNIKAIIYFILIGCFTFIFSRNISFVLFIALIITNLIIVHKIVPTKEGLQNNEQKELNDGVKLDGKNPYGTQNKDKNVNTTNVSSNVKKENFDLAMGMGGTPQSQSQNQTQTPSQPEGHSGGSSLTGSKVDYAMTVENAYDNLNKILGSDSMSRLTEDTKQLMTQQQQLAESMKSMEPLINNISPLLSQTKEMLGNMNITNIDQIANLVTNLTGKKEENK